MAASPPRISAQLPFTSTIHYRYILPTLYRGNKLYGEKDSIEKWVIHLIDNKKEMERLSSNAVKFVKKHYSLRNAVITENNDYQSLVNKIK